MCRNYGGFEKLKVNGNLCESGQIECSSSMTQGHLLGELRW